MPQIRRLHLIPRAPRTIDATTVTYAPTRSGREVIKPVEKTGTIRTVKTEVPEVTWVRKGVSQTPHEYALTEQASGTLVYKPYSILPIKRGSIGVHRKPLDGGTPEIHIHPKLRGALRAETIAHEIIHHKTQLIGRPEFLAYRFENTVAQKGFKTKGSGGVKIEYKTKDIVLRKEGALEFQRQRQKVLEGETGGRTPTVSVTKGTLKKGKTVVGEMTLVRRGREVTGSIRTY